MSDLAQASSRAVRASDQKEAIPSEYGIAERAVYAIAILLLVLIGALISSESSPQRDAASQGADLASMFGP